MDNWKLLQVFENNRNDFDDDTGNIVLMTPLYFFNQKHQWKKYWILYWWKLILMVERTKSFPNVAKEAHVISDVSYSYIVPSNQPEL